MASNLTEYERRRLENIKRNEEMMASLKLRHMSTHLSSAAKRQKVEKGYKSNLEKKPKSETPIVIRRSLRSSGIPPDAVSAKGLQSDSELADFPQTHANRSFGAGPSIQESGSLGLQQAYNGTHASYLQFINTISGMSENVPLSSSKKGGTDAYYHLGTLDLKHENVARVVPKRIFTVGFFPYVGRTVIFAGDKGGNVGFWDVDCEEQARNGLYLFSPHSAPVSGILVQHFLNKIFTSSYDGFIRMMNITEETFNMVYSGNDAIFSISQRPLDVNSLYFGEGQGMFKGWDERAGKIVREYELHDQRINSIDFSMANTNLMATSSTDATACIWDVRRIGRSQPQCIKTVHHKRAVYSAYFSPSGSCLATTSFDDTVCLLRGSEFEDMTVIPHNNRTSRWISTFKAMWGWDDSYLYIGNTKRAMDVISTANQTTTSLTSPYMTAIPCRFAAHPYDVGTLAGATGGGQVYMWTASKKLERS